HDAVAGGGERGNLALPGPRVVREAVQAEEERPAPLREIGEVESVRLDPPLAHASAASDALGEVADDLVDADPLLRARVTRSHRDRLVGEGLAVDRDAEGRARFVHARVALADRLLRVELRGPDAGAHVAIEPLGDL